MEWFFEDDACERTPSSTKLTASTPCTKGPTESPHINFPSNITPVAVKQLFHQTSGRHLSQFTWTSSLATGIQFDDSDVSQLAELTEPQRMNKTGEESLSLFSSWIEDTDIQVMKDEESTAQASDSLSDLLKTPPSLKVKARQFTVPKKRKQPSLDFSDDILSGLINQPVALKRSKVNSKPTDRHGSVCYSPTESSAELGKSQHKLSDNRSEMPLDNSLEDFVTITDNHVKTTSNPGVDAPYSTSALSERSDKQDGTPKVGRAYRSAFSHSGISTSKSGASSASKLCQFKAVRPSGDVREGRSGFFYPDSGKVVGERQHMSEQVSEHCEKNRQEHMVKPRRIAKFSTPAKSSEQAVTTDEIDSAYHSQTPLKATISQNSSSGASTSEKGLFTTETVEIAAIPIPQLGCSIPNILVDHSKSEKSLETRKASIPSLDSSLSEDSFDAFTKDTNPDDNTQTNLDNNKANNHSFPSAAPDRKCSIQMSDCLKDLATKCRSDSLCSDDTLTSNCDCSSNHNGALSHQLTGGEGLPLNRLSCVERPVRQASPVSTLDHTIETDASKNKSSVDQSALLDTLAELKNSSNGSQQVCHAVLSPTPCTTKTNQVDGGTSSSELIDGQCHGIGSIAVLSHIDVKCTKKQSANTSNSQFLDKHGRSTAIPDVAVGSEQADTFLKQSPVANSNIEYGSAAKSEECTVHGKNFLVNTDPVAEDSCSVSVSHTKINQQITRFQTTVDSSSTDIDDKFAKDETHLVPKTNDGSTSYNGVSHRTSLQVEQVCDITTPSPVPCAAELNEEQINLVKYTTDSSATQAGNIEKASSKSKLEWTTVGKPVVISSTEGTKMKVANAGLDALKIVSDNTEQKQWKPFMETRFGENATDGVISRTPNGFSTARDAKVNMLGTSLNAVKDMYDKTDEINSFSGAETSEQEMDDHAAKMSLGFSTASGARINVSSTSLNAVKSIFDNTELKPCTEGEFIGKPTTSFSTQKPIGFSTARGTKIKVSETSLNAVWKVFDSIEELKPSTGVESVEKLEKDSTAGRSIGFSTASGAKIKVSDASLNAVQKIFDSTDELKPSTVVESVEKMNKNSTAGRSIGFSTARGTKIKVSDASLNAVRKVFDSTDGLKPSTGVESVEKLKNDSSTGRSIGFSTARGTKIRVSDASLNAVQKIFDSTDELKLSTGVESVEKMNKNSTAGRPIGFSTARGAKIKVSDASLNAVQKIFDSTDELKPYTGVESVEKLKNGSTADRSIGFSTARGAKIKVSDASLNVVKSIFADDEAKPSFGFASNKNIDSPTVIESIGFSTARGRKIDVSEASFNAVKNMFDVDDQMKPSTGTEPGMNEIETPTVGFSTASGTKIRIFNTSLSHAKTMFDDTESPSLSNIQSASHGGYKTNGSGIINVAGVDEDISNCRQVPEQGHQTINSCQTPPVRRRLPSFRRNSPISVTPTSLIRDKSLRVKPYWTTPNASGKKFTFGNKPFKPHTPDRQAIANRLAVLQHTPPASSTNLLFPGVSPLLLPSIITSEGETTPTQKSVISFDPNTKSATLRKPTDTMMSIKRCKGKRATLRELGLPMLSHPQKVDSFHLTSITSADHVFTDITEGMRCEIQSFCTGYDITELLKAPISKDTLYTCLLMMNGIDPSLISKQWFNNHHRWVVWKLSCLQRAYSAYRESLTPSQVLKQIKYRYEREVDLSQRSALRKMYEGDDLASKTMILLVSSVDKVTNGDSHPTYQLELSDGWYSIKAAHDSAMNSLIDKGTVKEGCKLIISRAQMCGLDQACSPLSCKGEDARLKMSTNSVRRARYYAKLGYSPHTPVLSLTSLLPLGGTVACLYIAVLRVYPVIYMEKTDSGTVFRNEMKERQLQRLEAVKMEKLMEQQMDKENSREETTRVTKRVRYAESDVNHISTGQELHELIESSVDPEHTQMLMTERQRDKLCSYQQNLMCKRRESLQAKVRESLPIERKVTPMLKVRVAGLHQSDVESNAWTTLTLWRPAQEMMSLIREGLVFKAHNLSVSDLRGQKVNSPVLLSANKSSVFEPASVDSDTLHEVYSPRQLIPISDISQHVTGDTRQTDIDTAGIVTAWETAPSNLTVVFISDTDGNMISLNFWGGPKAYGYSDMIKEGSLVYFTNLSKSKTPLRYTLPSLTVTELTTLSSTSNKAYTETELSYTQQLSSLSQCERRNLVKSCQATLVKLATSTIRVRGRPATPSTPHDIGVSGYVPSTKARERIQQLDKSISVTDHAISSDVRLCSTLPDGATRRALTAQFQSPVRMHQSNTRPSTAPSTPPSAPLSAEEKDMFDDDLTDSQMLALLSQS